MVDIEDARKYPARISAIHLEQYIKRACPCIVVFEQTSDPESKKILKSVKKISKIYPRVFVYIIKWENYLGIFGMKYDCGLYDVIVWRANEIIFNFTEPTRDELNVIFTYVIRQITGDDVQVYKRIVNEYLRQKKELKKRQCFIIKEKMKRKCFIQKYIIHIFI